MRMRRILGSVVLLVLAAISLLFLQNRSHPADAPVAPSPSSTTTAPAPANPTPTLPGPVVPATSPPAPATSAAVPAPPGAEPDGTTVAPAATAAPRNKPEAATFKAAASTATAFMKAFARPGGAVDEAAWWNAVRSFMTDQAATDYEGVDPAQVPFSRVTGAPAVIPTDAPAALLTAVRVPTDAGDYVVELTSTEQGLKVSRVVPPVRGQGPS